MLSDIVIFVKEPSNEKKAVVRTVYIVILISKAWWVSKQVESLSYSNCSLLGQSNVSIGSCHDHIVPLGSKNSVIGRVDLVLSWRVCCTISIYNFVKS